MGKTSLAYVTIHDSKEIDDNFQVFFFDILQTNSLSEFTYLLGKSIFDTLQGKSVNLLRTFLAALQSLSGSFGFDAMSGTPTFNIQLGDIRHPEYTLDEIFKFLEQNEKPVIIVIDEFQQIAKYPEKNTEAILRTHIQRLSNVTFIFAGSEQTILQEMFASSKRPFYNSAEIMHLGPISEDVYVSFASEMFAARGKTIEADAVRSVFHLFNGNTFYLQRTMNGAFGDTANGGVCDKSATVRTIKSMLASNQVVYREMLSNITSSQKATLLAIAQEKTIVSPLSSSFIKRYALPSASSVQSSITKLAKAGFVIKTEFGYAVADPLLRIFINQIYGTPEV